MKRLLTAVVILLALAGGALGYFSYSNLPVNQNDITSKIFVVNRGESIREIGNNLKNQGLIRDPVAFFVYIKFNNEEKNIQAGDYRLSPSMNLKKVVDSLNHGTLDIWVTIPEGLRADEIADIFEKNLPSYKSSWRSQLESNEGYLFPDTYLMPRDVDANGVVSIMKNNFDSKIQETGLTMNDPRLSRIITIASLIEREAKFPEDMPIVSSVIQNRLEEGMKLDIDATVQYALGYQPLEKRWWKKELSVDDVNLASQYNTYRNPGLPPTPIGNPGVLAIKAALNPANNNYLYYVSDKTGRIHPASTIQEHNANIVKYLQ